MSPLLTAGGVFAALALLVYLALRGVNVVAASILCALIAAVTNGMHPAAAMTGPYAASLAEFARKFVLLFIAGSAFGQVMQESGAARSIAVALLNKLGRHRPLWAIMLTTLLLTYGGVSGFVVIFVIYPLGLVIMMETNLPKRLFLGAFLLGAATFPMTALPGTPTIQNNIPAAVFETPLTAGWHLGIVASVVMAASGMSYLEWSRRRALRTGEGFEASPGDVTPKEGPEGGLPLTRSAAPIAVVLAVIILPPWIANVAAQSGYPGLAGVEPFATALGRPLAWTCVGLGLGVITAFGLFRNQLAAPPQTLSRGVERAAVPLLNTAAIIGFGGVVSETDLFERLADSVVNAPAHPLVAASLGVNLFASLVGSSSGGLALFFEYLAPRFTDWGAPLPVAHRVVVIASGVFDSMPHSGGLITMLTVMGLSHRKGYRDVFITTVVTPGLGLLVVLALALLTT